VTVAEVLSYAGISIAAVVEGEVVYVSAAVLVAAGRLQPLPLIVAGTIGAAMGDQFYFYLFRGRISGWLSRSRAIASRHAAIVDRVRRHHVWMILAIRFAPGLRIAIAAACAHADVPPLRFTLLNLISAFVWAVTLLAFVVRGGPAAMSAFGLHGRSAVAVPAVLIVLFGWWLAHHTTKGASGSPRSVDQE
jgi:membrane protein DedA with SNARE-associated domain